MLTLLPASLLQDPFDPPEAERRLFERGTRRARVQVNTRGSIVIIGRTLAAALAPVLMLSAWVCAALAAQTPATLPSQTAAHSSILQLGRLSQMRTKGSSDPAASLSEAQTQRGSLETRHTSDLTLNPYGLVQPAPPPNWLPLGPQGIMHGGSGAGKTVP